MQIAVVGIGYVGLVTASIFSHLGHQVWAVDIDQDKIQKLNQKIVPFYEPGLAKLVATNLKTKRLIFTPSFKIGIAHAQVIFVCVGTPAKKNGDYDLSYIYKAVKSLARYLSPQAVVCIKSTVPPGTCEEVKKIIARQSKVPFEIASCPEFLQEGSAVEDSLHPARIVIGVESDRAKRLLITLHQKIGGPRLICDLKSAQLIKYAANAFLASKISFINSIARICDHIGADIKIVAKGLGLDPRIGSQFLQAGIGYGGSCFPKDTWALIAYANRLGYDFKFLKEVDRVNQNQIDYFVKKIITNVGQVKNKTLTVLGLAFKPNTDDIREASSVKIIRKLQKLGVKIQAYDPVAVCNAKRILPRVKFFTNPYDALQDSSGMIIVTDWQEFKKLDMLKVSKLMRKKIVIDGRNIFDSRPLKKLGFIYRGVGRN